MNRTRSWQHLGPNEISRMSLIVKIAALTGLLVHACHSSGTKVSIKENSETNLSSDSQRSLTSHYHFLSSSRLATYPNLTSKNRVSVPTINNKNRLLGNTIIKMLWYLSPLLRLQYLLVSQVLTWVIRMTLYVCKALNWIEQ